MSKRLKKHCDQRKTDINSFKSQTMLIPNDCIEYNKSTHVREIVVLIERLQRHPGYPATKTEATKIRNFLAFVFCSSNALRASNLINKTLHDFNSAKRLPEEYPPGWQIMANNYKTSFLYGTKTINLSMEVYSQAIIFRDYFRPIILNDEELPDEERYLFPTWKAINENPNQQLTASAIANILTQTFKDAKVYNVGFCDIGSRKIYKT